ncbi:RNA polymerase sigma factor RpoD/SigA [Bdellovibrionota bacterium]
MTKKNDQLPKVISTFEQYLQHVSQFPLLSPEEEYELALKAWEDKDVEAAQKLVTGNLRFVIKIANEYRNYGFRIMDLIQEGNIGLMRAVKTFNPYKNVKLITYAVWWIRSFLHAFIQRNWSMVKMGTTQAQRKLFYKLQQEKNELEQLGMDPTVKLLSTRLGVKESEVEEMQKRLSGRDLSLDTPIGEEKDVTHLDRVKTGEPGSDEQLSERQQREMFLSALNEFKKDLKEKDLYILENRMISESPQTLEAIGKHFGITKERVRQLEEKIKKNLKKYLETHHPDLTIK